MANNQENALLKCRCEKSIQSYPALHYLLFKRRTRTADTQYAKHRLTLTIAGAVGWLDAGRSACAGAVPSGCRSATARRCGKGPRREGAEWAPASQLACSSSAAPAQQKTFRISDRLGSTRWLAGSCRTSREYGIDLEKSPDLQVLESLKYIAIKKTSDLQVF